MRAELVHYSGGDRVYVPTNWKQPNENQLVGTVAERLIEMAGRCCYSSLGTPASRPSDLFHRNLAGLDGTTPHYSVHEHYHFTIETMLHPGIWLGIPDVSVHQTAGGYRVTVNLRHCLEWPNNVVFSTTDENWLKGLIARWGRVLRRVAFMAAPQIVSPSAPEAVIEHLDPFRVVLPERDTEVFVTLFLEDSRVWCYAPDTEVFTAKGWRSVVELRKGDALLTMNPETRRCRWGTVEKQNVFDYNGSLFGWENSQFKSPMLTPDHTVWAAPCSGDSRRLRGLTSRGCLQREASKIRCEELREKRFVMDCRILWENPQNPQRITVGGFDYDAKDLFSWLGWMATDGYVSKDDRRCWVTQSKPHNVIALRCLFGRLFGDRWHEYGPYREDGCLEFAISDESLQVFSVDMLGLNKSERFLNPTLFTYSRRLLRAFYSAVLAGDGHVTPGGTETLYCPSKTAAGQFQVLASRLGRSGNVREDSRIGGHTATGGVEFIKNKPCFSVCMSNRDTIHVSKSSHREVEYSGKVYCPTTKDGLIYVRRGGRAFWCGNSHEMVRHRFNISQRSGRFVDETDRADCIHPLLRDWLIEQKDTDVVGRVHSDILDYAKSARSLYTQICDYLQTYAIARGSDKLTARKQARSAARYYLGNGLSTELIMTCSVRSWRGIFKQRCNPAADMAIRELMEKAQELVKSTPFGALL